MKKSEIIVNGTEMSIDELSEYTCYMDESFYPLFSTGKSVRKLIMQGIKKNKLDCTPDDIKALFELDDQRFERPVKCDRKRKISGNGSNRLCVWKAGLLLSMA